MKNRLPLGKKATAAVVTIAAVVCVSVLLRSGSGQSARTNPPQTLGSPANNPRSEATVDLAQGQLSAIKIEPVGTYRFPVEREAIGSIDYDEDLAVQVFSPYQGKIIAALANLGDEVQKGQPLYTVDSPDLIQAESALISTTSTLELTTKHLARVKDL